MPRNEIHIRSYAKLLRVLEQARVDDHFPARVEALHVALEHRRYCHLHNLRRLLISAWNITDLTLHLPRQTVYNFFLDLTLPHLYSFDTNIPHAELDDFLGRHPSISELHLWGSRCRSSTTCPLGSVDLDGIDVLGCHYACLPAIVGQGVHYLEVVLEGSHLLPSDIFRPAPQRPNIQTRSLTVDIVRHDESFLDALTSFSPNTKIPRITEIIPADSVYDVLTSVSSLSLHLTRWEAAF